MKPLSSLTPGDLEGLRGILFDLDDTFLDGGVLTEGAYRALWRASRAGLRLVVVTGRPAGFGEVMARQWPVDAVVTENGAVALFRQGGTIARWQKADEATRRARRVRIAEAFSDLRQRFGEVRVSDDSHARVSDLALDIGESQHLRPELVARIESAARELGMRTFVSSVHLHLTLDPFDKATGTVDDGACFFAFTMSFGVANIKPSLPRLSVPPSYVASLPRGAGFAEIVDRILALLT